MHPHHEYHQLLTRRQFFGAGVSAAVGWAALQSLRAEDAKKLLGIGESKADPAVNAGTLAAWTMLANEMLNLDEILNK